MNSSTNREQVPWHYNNPPNMDVLSMVSPGKTTKADIKSLLNEPNLVQSHSGREIWQYDYIINKSHRYRYHYTFTFDESGKLELATKAIMDTYSKQSQSTSKSVYDQKK